MTLPPDYFERMYAEDPDPWRFRTRWYEARKRGLTTGALLEPRYASAFEPGCSIGVLTAELSARCDHLLAMDVSDHARRATAALGLANVEVRQGAMPADWPPGRFDLVILSEIGYYLDDADCGRLADQALTAGREVVAVHWRHPVPDYPQSGDRVHQIIGQRAAALGITRIVSHCEADIRLDSWCRDPRSVAERAGLLA